jgi:hypothetical protein
VGEREWEREREERRERERERERKRERESCDTSIELPVKRREGRRRKRPSPMKEEEEEKEVEIRKLGPIFSSFEPTFVASLSCSQAGPLLPACLSGRWVSAFSSFSPWVVTLGLPLQSWREGDEEKS